jgi:hypothetical protein
VGHAKGILDSGLGEPEQTSLEGFTFTVQLMVVNRVKAMRCFRYFWQFFEPSQE